MEQIRECYKSLENAKNDVAMLNHECDEMEQFRKDALYLNTNPDLYMRLPELLEKYSSQYKDNKKYMLSFYGLFYPAVLIVIFVLSLIFKFQPSFLISSFTSAVVTLNFERIGRFSKSKKKVKLVKKLASYCNNKSELDGLDLDQIITMFVRREKEYGDLIVSKRRSISEYEEFLEKCKEDVANQVLLDERIDATMEMEFTIPSKKKRLIKVDVNK